MKKLIVIILILLIFQTFSIEKTDQNPNGKKKLKKKVTAEIQTQSKKVEDEIISMTPQKMTRRTMAKTLRIEVECTPKDCKNTDDKECIKLKTCKQKIESKDEKFDKECCDYMLTGCTKNKDCKENKVFAMYQQNCCQLTEYSKNAECSCAFKMSRQDCFGRSDICKNCKNEINCAIDKSHYCCCFEDNCCEYNFETGLNNQNYEPCCKSHPDKEQCKCQYIMNHQSLFSVNQVKACCVEFPQIHPCSCKDKFIAPDCCIDFNILTDNQKQMCCQTPAFQSRKECCCYPCPPKDSNKAKQCSCPNCYDDCEKLAQIKKQNNDIIPFENDTNGELKKLYCKCYKDTKTDQYNKICNPCYANPTQTQECCTEFFKFKKLNVEENQVNYKQCCDSFPDPFDQCKCSYIQKNPTQFLPSQVKKCCKENFDNQKEQCCEFVYQDLQFYPQKNEYCHSCIALPKNPPIDLQKIICFLNFYMRIGLKICDSYCNWCKHPDNCISKDNCYTNCCKDYFMNYNSNKVLPENIIKKDVCCSLNITPEPPLKDICGCKDDMDKSDCNQVRKCCSNDDLFKQKNIKDCNRCNCNDQITPDDEQCCDQILKNNLVTYKSYSKCCKKQNANCCDCVKDPNQNCCCPNPQTTLPIKDINQFIKCCHNLEIWKKDGNIPIEIPQQCTCEYKLDHINESIFDSIKQQILDTCCKDKNCKYSVCMTTNCCKDGVENICCTEQDYKDKPECCNKDPFNIWCTTCEDELKKLKIPCDERNQVQDTCCGLQKYMKQFPCANNNDQCCCNQKPFDKCCCKEYFKNPTSYQTDYNYKNQISSNLGLFKNFKQECCLEDPDQKACDYYECDLKKDPITQDKFCCTKIKKGQDISQEWLKYCCENFKDRNDICPCAYKLKYPKCCSEKDYFNAQSCCDQGVQNNKMCCNYKFDAKYCCGKEQFSLLTSDQQKECCNLNYDAEQCCSINYKKDVCCKINAQMKLEKGCCDSNTLTDQQYKDMCCPQIQIKYKDKVYPDKRAAELCPKIYVDPCEKEPKPCECYLGDKPCSCYPDQPYRCCIKQQSPLYCYCAKFGDPSKPPCMCLQNTILTDNQLAQCCAYYNNDTQCKCFTIKNKYPYAMSLSQINSEDQHQWQQCCYSLQLGNKVSCGKCEDCPKPDCWGDYGNALAIDKPITDFNYQKCCSELVMSWDIYLKLGNGGTDKLKFKEKCCADFPQLSIDCVCNEEVILKGDHPDHPQCCNLPQYINRKECNCQTDVFKNPKHKDHVSCCKAYPKKYCTKEILKDPNHILFNCCCEANTPEICCTPAYVIPSILISDPLKQYCCKQYQFTNSCCQDLDYLKGANNREFCCKVAPNSMCCDSVMGCKECTTDCSETSCCTYEQFSNPKDLRHNECCLKFPNNPQCSWKDNKVTDCKIVLAKFSSYPTQVSEETRLFYDCCQFCKKNPQDPKCSDVPDTCTCPGYQECQTKKIVTDEVQKCCDNDKITACDCKCLPNLKDILEDITDPNNEYCCQKYSPTGKCPCENMNCAPSSFKNANDPQHDECCDQIKNDKSKQKIYDTFCAPPMPCVDCIQNIAATIQAQEYFNQDGIINSRGRMKKLKHPHSMRFNKNKYYTIIKNKTNHHQQSQNIL